MSDSWVLFSDLHVSAKTLDTCLKVLEEVHDYAAMRDAKVAFLGDFWDIRGTIPVRPLNRVTDMLASFEQPIWMIPGNHDQVSKDGLEHALSVFDSLPNVDVITEPKRDSANHELLFVPYRRDHQQVIDAVNKHKKGLRCVFCHIDVVGGMMNNWLMSEEGLKPDAFPEGVIVYSGHYHRPHTITREGKIDEQSEGLIRYIGSPYQVSAAEAHQQKWLTLVGPDYDIEEKRQIDVGRRYWTIGQDEPWPEHARKGDRVIIKADGPMDEQTMGKASELGVELQVKIKPKETTARIQNAEELSPDALFEEFSKISKMPETVTALGKQVLKDIHDEDRV